MISLSATNTNTNTNHFLHRIDYDTDTVTESGNGNENENENEKKPFSFCCCHIFSFPHISSLCFTLAQRDEDQKELKSKAEITILWNDRLNSHLRHFKKARQKEID